MTSQRVIASKRCASRSRQEYKRHSKSINTEKSVCGKCKSKLEFVGKFKNDGTDTGTLVAPRKVGAPNCMDCVQCDERYPRVWGQRSSLSTHERSLTARHGCLGLPGRGAEAALQARAHTNVQQTLWRFPSARRNNPLSGMGRRVSGVAGVWVQSVCERTLRNHQAGSRPGHSSQGSDEEPIGEVEGAVHQRLIRTVRVWV